MKYVVIRAFTDLQDNYHAYAVGDKFPHGNKRVKAERIQELLSSNNKRGKPIIKAEE